MMIVLIALQNEIPAAVIVETPTDPVCSNFFTNISGKMDCYEACPENYPVSVNGTTECLASCPSDTPYEDDGVCVSRCGSGAYKIVEQSTKLLCMPACEGQGLYIINSSNENSYQCIKQCPAVTPYYQTGACVAKCASQTFTEVKGQQTLMCNASCQLYIKTGKSKQCFSSCPDTAPFQQKDKCVARCPTGSYYVSDSTFICTPKCSGLYIINATNKKSKQCVDACPAETPYYKKGICSANCSSGAYSLIKDVLTCQSSCKVYVMNETINSKQCLKTCPAEQPFLTSGLCSAHCASNAYAISSGLKCKASCPKYFVVNVTDENSHQCVSKCTSGQTLTGKECVPKLKSKSNNLKSSTTFAAVMSGIAVAVVVLSVAAFVVHKKKAVREIAQRDQGFAAEVGQTE
ncbi:putative [Hexamita inflata]|uniref:Putative n=1 Tax=Hexamita inflata TaxID=28002 RepID=A0ABP1J6K2_9EUKA